jgi:alpha-1,3-glucosyltransferase
MLIWACLLATKLLLFPGYFSTDLDVHRNWLRVTSQNPASEWYRDCLNQWTLDYPPAFGYFQLALSKAGSLLLPASSITSPQDQHCPSTLLFMRASVLLTELSYHLAVWLTVRPGKYRWLMHAMLGVVLVDNLHFQYNAMMYALLLGVVSLAGAGRYVRAAVALGVLLSFKHLFVSVAPAMAVFYIR